MKCEICKKNEATLHIQEISNGRAVDLHLCDDCAGRRGIVQNVETPFVPLRGLLSAFPGDRVVRRRRSSGAECGGCGLTWEKLCESGRLGCEECWPTFRSEIVRLLRKIHGSASFAGEVPRHVDGEVRRKSEICRLQYQLKNAVRREEYERARTLRTRIERLESAPGSADA